MPKMLVATGVLLVATMAGNALGLIGRVPTTVIGLSLVGLFVLFDAWNKVGYNPWLAWRNRRKTIRIHNGPLHY